jgi:hypothetical protein
VARSFTTSLHHRQSAGRRAPQPPSAQRREPIRPADQALLDAALAPLNDPVLKDSVRRLVLRALTDPRRD